MITAETLLTALMFGVFLGGFYGLMSTGLSYIFGLMGIADLSYFGFLSLGGYATYLLCIAAKLDPIIAGLLLFPLFFLIGCLKYFWFNKVIEGKHGAFSLTTGYVLLFGLLIITEMCIYVRWGITEVGVLTTYTMQTITAGPMRLPLRLILPFIVCLVLTTMLYLLQRRTFLGIVMRGLALDELVLSCSGCNTFRIKMIIFGISSGLCSIAGGLLLAIQPINPFVGRMFIGLSFAICVLGGMGNIFGTLAAGIFFGTVENLASVLVDRVLGSAILFFAALLLLLLKPQGLFRR